VGQGSIAIECRKKLDFEKKKVIQDWVNHSQTDDCLRTERAFLKTLQGGCSIPAFGYAHFDGAMITMKGGIISLDGKKIVKAKRTAPAIDFKELGEAVANEVLINGGAEILATIKNS
jgi:hydroxymethylbilane synthase